MSTLRNSLLAGLIFITSVAQGQKIHEISTNAWYAGLWAVASVSAGRLLYLEDGQAILIDRKTGVKKKLNGMFNIGMVYNARMLEEDLFELATDQGLKVCRVKQPACEPSPLLGSKGRGWSNDGKTAVAYFPEGSKLKLYDRLKNSFQDLPALAGVKPSYLAVAANGVAVYVLRLQEDDLAFELLKWTPGENGYQTILNNLDGPGSFTRMFLSNDGKSLLLSLNSDGPPDLVAIQAPRAGRHSKIYAYNSETGKLKLLAKKDGQDLVLASMSDGRAVVLSFKTEMGLGIRAIKNGKVQKIFSDVPLFLPYWSPDDKDLSATYGEWRLADFALAWDAGLVKAEAAKKAIVQPLISGHHEDFSAKWSPDGKWMAFHSHRSPAPVFHYGGKGNTDDYWIRSVDPGSREFRLSRFPEASENESGYLDWSPDGKQILGHTLKKVWILDLQLGREPSASQKVVPVADLADVQGVAWSPRSQNEIAFSDFDHRRQRVWLHSLKDNSSKVIHENAGHVAGQGLSFSSDGRFLYFSKANERDLLELAQLEVATGKTTRLAGTEKWNAIHPQVSHDGEKLAFTLYRHKMEVSLLKINPQ